MTRHQQLLARFEGSHYGFRAIRKARGENMRGDGYILATRMRGISLVQHIVECVLGDRSIEFLIDCERLGRPDWANEHIVLDFADLFDPMTVEMCAARIVARSERSFASQMEQLGMTLELDAYGNPMTSDGQGEEPGAGPGLSWCSVDTSVEPCAVRILATVAPPVPYTPNFVLVEPQAEPEEEEAPLVDDGWEHVTPLMRAIPDWRMKLHTLVDLLDGEYIWPSVLARQCNSFDREFGNTFETELTAKEAKTFLLYLRSIGWAKYRRGRGYAKGVFG